MLLNKLTKVSNNLYRDSKGNAVQLTHDHAHPLMPTLYKLTFTTGAVYYSRCEIDIAKELKI